MFASIQIKLAVLVQIAGTGSVVATSTCLPSSWRELSCSYILLFELLQMHAQVILTCNNSFDHNKNMLVEVSRALKCLWHDKGVRTAVGRGYEYELNDSAI